MEILASCSLEESEKYVGKLLIDSEDGSKPDKVSLNLVIEDGNTSILSNLNPNVKCITYKGDVDLSSIEIPKGRVFREFSLDEEIIEQEGVTPLVRVPDGYSDMRTLLNICTLHPSVRIIGGNLLNIDGVRIGRYSIGKDKGSPVYCGLYDQFLEVPLSDLGNIQEVVKKARKKLNNSNSDSSKTSKPKKTTVKKNVLATSFNTLFSGAEEEF